VKAIALIEEEARAARGINCGEGGRGIPRRRISGRKDTLLQ
jgi:hypothetical protein